MIELKNVSKSFDGRSVLRSISYTFPEAGVVAVMGPSGGGKTTLLRIMLGLTKPDEGSVVSRARMGAVFQEDRLIERMSARGNLSLVSNDERQIREHIAKIGLAGFENMPASKMSGGMRRRIALARGVLFPCDALLMDEPFKGLDEDMHRRMIEYVLGECPGRLIVFVTHDAREAQWMGARDIIEIG